MEKKTSIITIPQYMATFTLKGLYRNNISCQYEGIDQTGRILIRLNYLSDQDRYLRELFAEMEEGEKLLAALIQIGLLTILNETDITKFFTELAQLKKEYGNRQK